MKLAVIGSRTFTDYEHLAFRLDFITSIFPTELIISGGAIGADTLAEQYADENNIEKKIIEPNYQQYTRTVAPIIRNTEIINLCDFVVAFWNGKSNGTLDAIRKARKQNKEVFIV